MHRVEANGASIPALGLGTWRLDGRAATEAVGAALAAGWRHVDTARMYGNEAEVGAAVRAADTPRDEIFVTTKIWPDDHAPDRLRRAAESSLSELGLDHVDLLLLHWPSREVPLEETIPALAKLAADGLAAHVGVSNFTRAQVDAAAELSDAPLAVNQVEMHPFLDQSAMLKTLARHGMAATAYCPLAKGGVAEDPRLREMAEKRGATPGQVALAWILSKDAIAVPKTANPARMEENLAAAELRLTEPELHAIDAMARPDGRLVSPDGVAPDWD